jgi:two-component system, OmpR family, sensor histidine kinase BaeS
MGWGTGLPMSEQREHRWRMPRRRPAWWPKNEAWPPSGPGGQQAMQWMMGRFMRRMIGLVVMFVVLTVGSCTLAFWLTAAALGALDQPEGIARIWRAAIPAAAVVLAAVGLVGLALSARALRRMAAPVNEFMGAVERVADGDFQAQVKERGPREMRRLARAFNGMTARLQASEAQRRSLLADVTHELRAPLTVIQGQLEGLLDGVYPADAAHLAPILDETRVLSRLIDDLRTLAQAESGTLALHREPTDLAVLCAETAAGFRAPAEAAGVALATDLGDDLPLLNVDPVRVREVVSNLLANALRYTPAGGRVELAARREIRPSGNGGDGQGKAAAEANKALGGREAQASPDGDAEGEEAEVITVTDTGAGIAAEALPHIFERFYKSADSRGSGLGLAIARNLVEAHGGRISAESTLGVGTTVRVEL